VLGGGTNGCPQVAAIQMGSTGMIFSMTFSTTDTYIRSPMDLASNSATGSFIIRQGDNITNANTALATARPLMIRAGNNAATNALAQSASLGIFSGAGIPVAGTVRAAEGFLQLGQAFYPGAAPSNLWNLQCQSGVEQTVQDCPATPAYIIGVAQVVTVNMVTVIEEGEVPINCPGSCTVGHTVCAGATAGQITDSGGTGACAAGFLVGVVNRISGSYILPVNNTTTGYIAVPPPLSATLPSVILLGHK
jgi:hypothetical protein